MPLAVLTVIVTVPAFLAETTPLELTEAIEESLEDQVTALLEALEGETVALRVEDSPTTKVSEDLLSLTLENRTRRVRNKIFL